MRLAADHRTSLVSSSVAEPASRENAAFGVGSGHDTSPLNTGVPQKMRHADCYTSQQRTQRMAEWRISQSIRKRRKVRHKREPSENLAAVFSE